MRRPREDAGLALDRKGPKSQGFVGAQTRLRRVAELKANPLATDRLLGGDPEMLASHWIVKDPNHKVS